MIIGVAIAASVASAIILIITLLCVRHNHWAKKKYQTRQDSHEYTKQPSTVRLFIV